MRKDHLFLDITNRFRFPRQLPTRQVGRCRLGHPAEKMALAGNADGILHATGRGEAAPQAEMRGDSPRKTAHNPDGCWAFRIGLHLVFRPDAGLPKAC